MIPKEKAEELVNKFLEAKSNKLSDYSRIEWPTAKQCALVCVDEILAIGTTGYFIDFWSKTKEEILNL